MERCRPGTSPTPVIVAALERVAAAGELAVVGQRLAHAHRDRGAERGGEADEQGGPRPADVGGREDRRQCGDGAVDETDEARLDDLQEPVAVGGARATWSRVPKRTSESIGQ